MNFTTLDIILVIVAAILVAVIVVGILSRKKFAMKTFRRLERRYTTQLRDCNDEIRRLNTLLDNQSKQNATEQPQIISAGTNPQLVDINRFAMEQKKLEAKQQELTDRNKQLWDISVSIEKERMHVQQLKNEIEEQHQAVTSSIRYAKLIQNAVLPSEAILKESFEDVFLFWRPRDIVSGDFYWMKRIGDTVIFTVADCTGHGVPGAFMSMLGIAFLNEICVDFHPGTTPAQILEEMRDKVISTLRQTNNQGDPKDGMDMGLCILNLATMKMQFAGANNGMYHVRGTTLTEYTAVKNPVGIYQLIRSYVNYDVDIQHGDYIYMFSDGYADQFNKDGYKFTLRRLRKLIVEINSKTKVAAQQAELLSKTLDGWLDGNRQIDDILIGGYCIR